MEDVARLLEGPRVVWLMLPAGDITDQHEDEALGVLEAGDLIVEGSNGKWSDAIDQDARARQRGVGFVDVGVSGGVWGLENGYSLMAGGTNENIALVAPAFKPLAPTPDPGWGHVGPVGSGPGQPRSQTSSRGRESGHQSQSKAAIQLAELIDALIAEDRAQRLAAL